MGQIKQIKRTYVNWFLLLNLGFIFSLFAMNLFYNHILGKNLVSASLYTVLSIIAIYSLAASYFMLMSRRTWKRGILVTFGVMVLLLYSSNRAIFDILPQWGDPAYEGQQRPSMKEYVLVMGPRLFYYSFIAIAIALNIRLGLLAIRSMEIEIEKADAEKRELEATKKAQEMELRAWGAYTNPHFLENELRAVAGELLYAVSDAQRRYLKRRLDLLADISGYNSDNVLNDRRIVVFSKEWQQLKNYLESRDTESESYLRPMVEMTGKPMGHKIVPMTLVYLTEGAFKHGDLLSEPLLIRIGLSPDRIEILIRNRIPGKPRAVISTGSGLKIIRRRLALAMPGRFTWSAQPVGDFFEVAITINQYEQNGS